MLPMIECTHDTVNLDCDLLPYFERAYSSIDLNAAVRCFDARNNARLRVDAFTASAQDRSTLQPNAYTHEAHRNDDRGIREPCPST
jgi:hypothetical protein